MLAEAALPYATPADYLFEELAYLELLVKRQVVRLRAASQLTENDFRGLYIADAQVDALLGAAAGSSETAASVRALDVVVLHAREKIDARARASDGLQLRRVADAFGLTPFERDILLIALAPEIDLRWETLYAYVQNDVTKRRPTVDLALKLLCAGVEERVASRDIFRPNGALARYRLVRLVGDVHDPDPPLVARYIRIEDRVADALLGVDDSSGFDLEPSPRPLEALVLPEELRTRIGAVAPVVGDGSLVLFLNGPSGSGRRALAGAVAAAAGRGLLSVELSGSGEPDGLALRREAMLQNSLLYVDGIELLLGEAAPEWRHEFLQVLDTSEIPVVLASQRPWEPSLAAFEGRLLSLELGVPAFPVRLSLCERALAGNSVDGAELATIADAFKLGPARIASAALDARQLTALGPEPREATAEDVRAAARAQSSRALHGLAEKLEPVYSWADIVLPRRAIRGLREICASVEYRHVVYSDWRFDARFAHGRGVNVLFSGPSGTGKTMAARVIARQLGLDLYAIDLATVVSKYIGETERNLRRIFRAAEWCNAILFFDEADALFGKRSEIRDAHDRYANIEVAFLLQQMEQYEGVVILATNLRNNLDHAFARRMSHMIEFPLPDAAAREAIWRIVFPAEAPLAANFDRHFLAEQFELTGGNIRNAALAASFMAAEAGTDIGMEQLVVAVARELAKEGRLPSRGEFRDYFELLCELE